MKKTTMRLFVLALLTMFSLGAEAKVDVEIGKFTGGTIKETGQTDPDKNGLVTVTITVTPDNGYTITKDDITVVSTYPATGTRNPEIAGNLKLIGDDPKDLSEKRDYRILVDANLGIWVKEANFKLGGSKGPSRSVPFDVSTAEEKHLYWLESKGAAGFYMIAHNVNNKNSEIREASTSNLPNPNMLWYFMDAGEEGDVHYYYIVNKATDKYLWLANSWEDGKNNNNTIQLCPYNEGNADRFKFAIEEKETGWWAFYPKDGNNNYWINKRGGNQTYSNYLKASNFGGSPDDNSKWKIVAENEVTWAHPFTNSTDENKHYYLIQNAPASSQSFYLSTDNNYAAISNESNNKRIWYFVEVPSQLQNTTIPNLKFYYIVNASTGRYLYFNSKTTNGNQINSSDNGVDIRDYESGSNEDRYQFAVVNAIGSGTGTYSIVPKLLIGLYYNKSAALGVNSIDNNVHIGTVNDRATNSSGHWMINETTFSCGRPEISFDNTTNQVTMESETEDAVIYYTTDGSNPDLDHVGDNNPTKQYNPADKPTINAQTTIKAIATKTPMPNSPVETKTIYKVATPTVSYDVVNNVITITTSTEEATIHYTTATTEGDLVEPTMTTGTTCSSGDELRNGVSNRYIKAIAVKDGYITSDVSSLFSATKLKCANPVVQRNNESSYTMTCEYPEGVIVHYTTDNTTPTTSSGTWAVGTSKSFAIGTTIKLMATAPDYDNSDIVTKRIMDNFPEGAGSGTKGDPYRISTSELFDVFMDLVDNDGQEDRYYQVTADLDISDSPVTTGIFKGHLDGGLFTLTGLSHPLFNSINGGSVKNVILKNVKISKSGNVGAIAGEALGYTRIYNCGILPTDNKYENETSYLSSTGGYCGGLVGRLRGDSRVINCFSYANITGGIDVAGIVGHVDPVVGENGSNTEVSGGKYVNLRTAVVNCMFYGNITGGSNRWPVYGGAKMLNTGETAINNYDFYRADASLGLADNNHYNCSWPAKEEFLTQYEYYRYLLNSNRELCGWWVKSDVAPNTLPIAEVQAIEKDASLMAKWVLDPSVAPYPILKPAGYYPSAINQSSKRIDPTTKKWVDRAESDNTIATPAAPDTDGQTLGSVSVTINAGDHNTTASDVVKNITITAMDFANNDYCYGKIQLPYYNEIFGNPNGDDWNAKYGKNYTDMVVTGWTISAPEITDDSFSTDAEEGYNFADRKSTAKDASRVFAQGGYYYVPEGVSSITITAKWATAKYIDNTDHSYDRVYMSKVTDSDAKNPSSGIHFAPAGYRPTTLGNGQTVQNGSISSQITSGTVYENALVLVGNHQYRTGKTDIKGSNNSYGLTMMSADLDFDNEPDNCLIWQLGYGTDRQSICPVRFDFLPVVEIGMAMKEDASTQYYSLGCYRPLGHYEVTETSLLHFGQFEYGHVDRTIEAPLILNGGIFDQYTKGTKSKSTADDKITYVILGGNVYIPSFTPGAHVNEGAKYPTRHCPVNVIGGRINYLYLTGNYNDGVTPNPDNPHCYIDGGHFTHVAAAGKEGINGNVYFNINHSVINEFYGGSTLADKRVTGNIEVTINNSYVTKYCGGPKFGNMYDNKTVKTTATGTTFNVFYGGGNGGTSYMQYKKTDVTVADATANYDWSGSGALSSYTAGKYRNGNKNYMADYEMEIVNSSAGTDAKKAIFRTYFYAAQFSATNTGPITNILTNCKVLTNFFGGGNLGGVIGDVTSTLTNTQVDGDVFGAGYSASVPEVNIYEKDKDYPTINVYTGIITPTPEGSGSYTTYTWTNKTSIGGQTLDKDHPASPEVDGKRYYFTEEPLTNLGTVTGNVTLTIDGETAVVKHSVYGGGMESGVDGNTVVEVNAGTIGYAGADHYGADIGNVYGGGKGMDDAVLAGIVTGNTSVTISGTAESPFIYHNVYGGGAYGSVGTYTYTNNKITGYTSGGKCEVNITGGKIGTTGQENGMVFGSSRGDVSTPVAGVDFNDYLAWVHDTHVVIGTDGSTDNTKPLIKGSVYGGGENGHTYTDTKVDIHSGTIGIVEGEEITEGGVTYDGPRYPNRGNVYGGGCGTDTYQVGDEIFYNLNAGIVLGNTEVNIDGGHVVHNVYGAGAMGSAGTFTLLNYTTHADYHTAHPNVPKDKPHICADNTGKCSVNISGGKIGVPGAQMTAENGPDDFGHVFGAGRGELKDSTVYVNMPLVGYVNSTDVKISDNAFITGSVYGGGENGHVLGDTYVTVSGGQIGCGENKTEPYGDGAFESAIDASGNVTSPLEECAHWDYSGNYSPYDKYAGDSEYTQEAAAGGLKVATDGHTFYGNVFGGGSGFYPYAPGKWVRSAGLVEGDTHVTINGGHILSNVYGGNEHTDVYGDCYVTMTGGTVGVPMTYTAKRDHPRTGNLFGAGKGDKRILFNTWTNVKSTTVTVSGGRVYGAVFGGGEDGHVLLDATTTIDETNPTTSPTIIGTLGTTGYDGYVFGGGRGSYTALTAGVVCGNVTLNIEGGKILGSAYGGGRLSSVGTHLVPPNRVGSDQSDHTYYGKEIADGYKQVDWENYWDDEPGNDGDIEETDRTHGHITVNISGGTIGAVDASGKVLQSEFSIGDVFGGCKGTTNGEYAVAVYDVDDPHAKLGIAKSTTVNLLGGTVHNSIYGGGELGNVGDLGVTGVEVHEVGPSTLVYEDASLAYAKINLLGGSVGNVFGGGLGMKQNVNGAHDAEALVKGDVKVNLNGLESDDYVYSIHSSSVGDEPLNRDNSTFYRVANGVNSGCIVNGTIFGCNNINGTPLGHAKVHVFKTTKRTDQAAEGEGEDVANAYDVAAVYGGGNRADYVPGSSDTQQQTEVIIEGCGLTSIYQVYGGGNAAATPGTLVTVKGTKMIYEVFGGGNGVSTAGFTNPGANVGYRTEKDENGQDVGYGGEQSGRALVQLMAGRLIYAYGGSNTKGDIRKGSNVQTIDNQYVEGDACCEELLVDHMFGGGKNAGMKSGANIIMGCSNSNSWVKEIYAGAENADVLGDVSLTITSGKFGRVFGGNKESGKLEGSITVNIEENGQCGIPIIIGELYGGGNKAAYSIYGYNDDGTPKTSGENPKPSPVVNVRSFTSIGNIFGGGYGAAAVMYGSPTVNINEIPNHKAGVTEFQGNAFTGQTLYFVNDVLDPARTAQTTQASDYLVTLPSHEDKKMGAIQNVFGGGNAAAVYGNTRVNIAVTSEEPLQQLDAQGNPVYTDATKTTPAKDQVAVEGADIRGNVYGGGNEAIVSGNTDVVIGRDGSN